MGNEIKYAASSLKMVTEGPGWHGPAIQQVLKDVTAEEAREKPATGGACIWELLLHMRAWEQEAMKGMAGERVRMENISHEEDWPPLTDSSDAAWDAFKAQVATEHRELREALKKLTPEHLEQNVDSDFKYPLYALIHGIIAHEAYHAGQIGLIKSSLRRKG